MADAIVIQVKLGTDDIDRAGKEIASKLSNALDVGVKAAREAGKKIGEALGGGIEAGSRYTSREERERAHRRRVEAIHEQSAARIKEIEARRQAQLDAIRERAAQREIEQQRKLERAAQSGGGGFQAFLRRYSSTIREAGESIQQAGYGALGLTTAIIGVGTAAIRSAIEIDKQVNALKALTGSAEAAEKRFAQLIAISQKTPGLTASLATTLDAQLRVANVTEQTINRILPAIGRLNAISPVGDASEFARNLAQIGQSFDKADIKQLVERSAFSGELLKQLFNVDSATNAGAIRESVKKLGIKTVDEFVSAFAQAAENNPKLASVTESLGTQLEKLQDRISIALRPLGVRILEIVVPAVEVVVPVIEKVFNFFSQLPSGIQVAIIAFGALVASIGPVVIGLGGMIQFLGAIGNLTTVITALNAAMTATAAGSTAVTVATGGFLATLGPLLGVLGAVAVAIGIGVYALGSFESAQERASKVTTESFNPLLKQMDLYQQVKQDIGEVRAEFVRTEQGQRFVKEVTANLSDEVRGYISTLDAEGKAQSINNEISKQAGAAKIALGEKYRELAAGIYEAQSNIANFTQEQRGMQEQIEKLPKGATEYKEQIVGLDGSLGEVTITVENAKKSIGLLATKISDNKGKLIEYGSVVASLANKFGGSEAALRSFLKAIGESDVNIEKGVAAMREFYKAIQEGEKARAKESLSTIQGIKDVSRVTEDEYKAAKERVENAKREFALTGESLASIRKRDPLLATSEAVVRNVDRRERVIEGSGRSGGTAERDAKAIAKARRRAAESAIEDEFRFNKASNDRILKNNEYFYSQGLRTVTEFYGQKLALTQTNIQQEIKVIDSRIAQDRAAFENEKLTTSERIELIDKLAKAGAERVLKERELGDVEIETAREIAAAKKAQYEAQIQFAREARENTYQLDKDANDRALEELQGSHDVGLVSTESYYKKKLELQQKNIQGAIDLNDQEIRDFKEKLSQYKDGTTQRIEIETILNNLRAKGVLLTRDLVDLEKALNRERNAPIDVLEKEIRDLQIKKDELNNPELAAKRREKAQVEAEYEIAKASDDAASEIIKNRAKIADASIYHANRANSIFLDHLAKQQSVTEAVADSMIKMYEGVASGLDRGIDRMTKKLGVFGGFVNGIIKSIARNLLASLFAPQQQGGGQQSANGGLFGGIFGGLFGGNRGGGVGPGGTPVFNPGYFNGNGSNNGGGGFNLTTLSSLTSIFSGSSGENGGGGGGIFGGIGGGSGSGLKGFGSSLKDAAPLLGATIGASLGGKSTMGQILGGVGGFLIGNSIMTGALLSNPITAIIGAGLLIGGIFAGKAKQRKQDEAASGEYLKQALDAIQELKSKIASDEIAGSEAKSIFENQILATFQQQISQLKTKSVRESRLTNQVRDLRSNYEALIPPEIEAQQRRKDMALQRQQLAGLLIPEFAVGGFVPGAVGSPRLILAHGGEMVVNPAQQTANLMHAAANAGVPGAQGGTAKSEPQQPQTINVTLVIGTEAQNQMFVNGVKSNSGYRTLIQQIQNGLGFNDFRLEGA